jgi:hypothetical protein
MLRNFVINYLTKNLLKAVTEEDILRKTGKEWLCGNLHFKPDDLAVLKQEADALRKSLLWKMMQRELTWLSNQKMFEKSMSNDDIIFGKAMLYNQKQQQDFLDKLAQL